MSTPALVSSSASINLTSSNKLVAHLAATKQLNGGGQMQLGMQEAWQIVLPAMVERLRDFRI